MIKHFLKFGNKTLIATLETLAVLFLLLLLATGALIWRVSEGPLSVSFAKDYIESALSDDRNEMYITFDDIVFTWPEVSGPFQLDVKKLRVQKGKTDANALNIDDASIGLSRTALLFGRIRPVSVIIKSPSLELVRDSNGHLNLFVQDKEVQEEIQEEEKKAGPQQIAQIFKDMASKQRRGGTFLSRLDAFIIENASVAVRDHEYGLSWYIDNLDFSIEERPQGVGASIVASLPGGREQSAGVQIDMVYRKNENDFRAAGSIKDVNPYAISRFLPVPELLSGQDFFFSGEFESAMDENLVPTYVNFKGAVPEGTIDIPEQFDAPIHVKNIAIASEYKSTDEMLTLSNLSGEINGIPFTGNGKAAITETSITAPIQLKVAAGAKREDLPPLFPKSEQDGQAYEWLSNRISGGTFRGAELNMELIATKTRNEELQREEWDVKVPQLLLDFGFEGATVQYHPTLMPAKDASGKGTLDLAAQTLVIEGESAKLGDLTGTAVNVKITDIMTAGAGYAYIKAKVAGPLSTALAYIASEPINMNKERIGIEAKNVKGSVDLDVDVSLPTTKDVPKEKVDVGVNGMLSNVELPGVVKGLTLSGGPLSVATEEGGFRIKGAAKLAGRDTTLEWHQYFESAGNPYSMQVKAKIGADQELRQHFGVNLDEYISGTMPVDVVYTDKGPDSSVAVTGDLNPVRIYIKTFKFEKPVGMPGTLSTTAVLKDDVLKELQNLTLDSKEFKVSKANIKFAPMNGKQADLSNGQLGDVTLGRTKMNVSFDVSKNNVMKVTAKGPTLDAMPFLQEAEVSKGAAAAPKKKVQAMNISVTADEMLAKNDQIAKNNKIYLEIDTDGDFTQMEYDGIVGKSPLFVRFKPDETGARVFRLESNDAGNVLYASGLYENIHGGRLLIYGSPKQGGDLRGDLHGSMRMENFRVTKAPALAKLLSLMSLTGVTQLLGNEGLVFSKLEADFEWRFREAGNLLIIKDGKTSGSSIGLTFEGVINRGTKTTDIGGTIIPMTEINSFLSKIPLIGNILGGETGLIAATYTMKGPSNKPTVMVNPLSVLAPGFLRNILFEGGYKNKIPGDDEPEAKPAPAAAASRTGNDTNAAANTNLKTAPSAKTN